MSWLLQPCQLGQNRLLKQRRAEFQQQWYEFWQTGRITDEEFQQQWWQYECWLTGTSSSGESVTNKKKELNRTRFFFTQGRKRKKDSPNTCD